MLTSVALSANPWISSVSITQGPIGSAAAQALARPTESYILKAGATDSVCILPSPPVVLFVCIYPFVILMHTEV